MKIRIGAAGLAAIALSACASQGGPPSAGPAPKSAPTATNDAFQAADFAWSKTPGRGRIDGQLTFGVAGKAYTCADAPVVLTPETPWVRRRMAILYGSDKSSMLPADEVRRRTPPERSQDYSGFVRRVTCDAAGRFSFSGLPDGSWFVITVARPPSGVAGREMALMRHVTLRNGESLKLTL